MASLALAMDVLARDRASGTFNTVGSSADGAGRKVSRFGTVAKAGMLAAGVAVAAFGKGAVKAAIEGEQSTAKLAQALKNQGESYKVVGPQVDALSTKYAKFGFENDEVEAAIATMTTSLGSSKKAMGNIGLAADLAKSKHISLADASLVVAKATQGQLKPLKQLGIDLPVAAGGALKLQKANDGLTAAQAKVTAILKEFPNAADANSKAHDKYAAAVAGVDAAQKKVNDTQAASKVITEGLAKAVGGQASAASQTLAGKAAALHAQWANFQEAIGAKLLPILTKMIDKLTSMAEFVQRNSAIMGPLIGIVAGLAAAVIAVNTAARIYTATQAALNVVMSLNPIGLVVIAIAALAAGLVLAWKHSETFRNIVTTAFSKVLEAVGWVMDKFGDLLGALGHIPGFGWAKTAADLMHGAANKAKELADRINGIPNNKTISLSIIANQTSLRAAERQLGIGPALSSAVAGAASKGGSAAKSTPTTNKPSMVMLHPDSAAAIGAHTAAALNSTAAAAARSGSARVSR